MTELTCGLQSNERELELQGEGIKGLRINLVDWFVSCFVVLCWVFCCCGGFDFFVCFVFCFSFLGFG